VTFAVAFNTHSGARLHMAHTSRNLSFIMANKHIMKQVMPPLSRTSALQSPRTADSTAWLLLLCGILAMYVPTYMNLSETIWQIVGQGHGPVILALTIWLIWQRWENFAQANSKKQSTFGLALFAIGLATYTIGRSQEILMLDAGSQLFIFTGIALTARGWEGLRKMIFPILFMILLVPLPGPLVDAATGPLKLIVSYSAENILYAMGYPVGRAGVTLTIGTYQLMVADACAGLNSIFALEAVGVFYLSVSGHTSKIRQLALASLILPISFIANVTRVITLVLITYYFGDEAGQGFLHEFASILLFTIATLLTLATDGILGKILPKNQAKPA
jgi:exosortase B